MKKITLLLGIITLLTNMSFAQEDKTVTLTVSGQGKTQDEAKQNALRYAIEQAFGTFISSNTTILNDELVKDEISSVSSGNIQKFDVVSAVEIPNGGYATILKATVSVTKLTSFVKSRGFSVEFKGSLFGANIRQQKMNEEAELEAIINMCKVSNKILSKSIDYSIEVDEPVKATSFGDYEFASQQADYYEILFTVKATPNKNFDKFVNYFYSNIKAISMPVPEQENYKKLNKDIIYLTVNDDEKYFFRNLRSGIALQNLFLKSNQYLHNFKVVTNLNTINVDTCCRDNVDYSGDQNMYKHHISRPEIWHLNSDDDAYSSEGSENGNPGYPKFKFPGRHGYDYGYSSWLIYFKFLYHLRNNEILFESKNYFK